MKRLAIGTVGVLLFAVALAAQAPEEQAIRKVLDDQAAAWNRHDLEGFMAGYRKSSDLTFFSGGTITRGWQPTLERYRARYQAAGREMGTLDFSDVTIQMLSPDAACVRGRFHLKMSDGKEPRGLFTLIVRKGEGGWKIVHDHSSSE